jgi:hypothetical protein
LCTELWRIKRRETAQGGGSKNLASLERCFEALAALGIEVVDWTAMRFDDGLQCVVLATEGAGEDGEGELVVEETVLPGVRIQGVMVRPPEVILGRRRPADRNGEGTEDGTCRS